MTPTVAFEFASIAAMGHAVNESGAHTPGDCSNDCEYPGGIDYGGWTRDKAISVALAGGDWLEGAQQIKPVDLDVAHLTADGTLPQPTLVTDVAGFAPCVPLLYSGSPECMFALEPEDSPAKILRVGVHIGRTAETTSEQVFNRGNAILSVVNALQLLGYQCEIWALWHNAYRGVSCHVSTCIKQASEFWDPSAVAFALCHPAFSRRLTWRLAESRRDVLDRMLGSYGNGAAADLSAFDLAFDYQIGDDSRWYSADSSLAWVLSVTREQLATIDD